MSDSNAIESCLSPIVAKSLVETTGEAIDRVRSVADEYAMLCCPLADDSEKAILAGRGDFVSPRFRDFPILAGIEICRNLNMFFGKDTPALVNDIKLWCRAFNSINAENITIQCFATGTDCKRELSPFSRLFHADVNPVQANRPFIRLVRVMYGDGLDFVLGENVDRDALERYISYSVHGDGRLAVQPTTKHFELNRHIVKDQSKICKVPNNFGIVFRGGIDGLVHRSPTSIAFRFVVTITMELDERRSQLIEQYDC